MDFMMADEAIDALFSMALRGERPHWPFGNEPDVLGRTLQRIELHGIALLLRQPGMAIEGLPAAVTAELARLASLQEVWENSHREAICPLLHELAEDDLAALVMKGTRLAYSAYCDPVLRQRGDTDLLVHADQLDAVRAVLARCEFTSAGGAQNMLYQEVWHSPAEFGMSHMVDLHWEVLNQPGMQSALPASKVFDGSCDLPRLATGAKGAGDIDTFVHGIINQAWHSHFGYMLDGKKLHGAWRLAWLYDNHLLASRFSDLQWGALMNQTAEAGLSSLVLSALRQTNEQFGTIVPRSVLHELKALPGDERAVRYITSAGTGERLIQDLRATGRMREKLALLRVRIFPPAEGIRIRYPDKQGWPVALLYLRRVAGYVWRLAKGLRP